MSIWTCLFRTIKSTAVVAGIWAGILLIEKNSITESRYYFVTALLLNVLILTLGMYFAQRYTIETFHIIESASICAILTTRARAPIITGLLKKDWFRRMVAGGDGFVAWVREHAIDEAYI